MVVYNEAADALYSNDAETRINHLVTFPTRFTKALVPTWRYVWCTQKE